MSEHTQGPWEVEGPFMNDDQRLAFISAPSWGEFARVIIRMDGEEKVRDEGLANARLIAAAPDMMQALDGIDHFSDALNYRNDTLSVELRKWIDAGRAAIAKARGEA